MTRIGSMGALLGALFLAAPAPAAERCATEAIAGGAGTYSPWVTKRNWLAPEHLRYGLGHMEEFMPLVRVASPGPASEFRKAAEPLDLQALRAVDPMDRRERSVAFLLNSRLYADGVVVVRNGMLLSEDYRNGLSAEQPRMILSATRPVIAMLAAISTAQGRLRQEKALSRHLPELSSLTELRKISLHRLLNEPAAFQWSEEDISHWKHVSGWDRESPQGSIRSWIKTASWQLAGKNRQGTFNGPEGQLQVWAVEKGWNRPIPGIFCERLFSPLHPEYPAYWATDGEGNALADGLALSLRDFARLGGGLLEAQGSFRGVVPNWFAEGVAAAGNPPDGLPPYLEGLEKGSQVRYGFVNLPGRGHRAAAIGSYGNSLFIDFDRRLVVAIFASYPAERTPLMLQTLASVWDAIAAAGGKPNR